MSYINRYSPFDTIVPWYDDRLPWKTSKQTQKTLATDRLQESRFDQARVRYSVTESGESLVTALFDVPGISKENVTVSYDDEHHILSVKTSEELENRSSSRTLKVSVKPLVVASIKAKCEHGRVTVTGTLVTAENKKTRHLVSVE